MTNYWRATDSPEWLKENRLDIARYAFDGEELYAPIHYDDGWHLVRVTVACAAGEHARVVNEKRGIERWFSVWNLYRQLPVKQGA
jgi:hypothetical protein